MTKTVDSTRVITKMTEALGLSSQEIVILKVQIDMLVEENEKLKTENEILNNKK